MLLVVFGLPGLASGQEALGTPELQTSDVSPPASVTNLIVGATRWTDPEVRDGVLRDLFGWLRDNEGLPPADELPLIAYAAPDRIEAVRNHALSVNPSLVAPGRRTTVAIYLDEERAIYLPDDFRAASAVELSVLVHELVHHVQQASGRPYECMQAREKEAYAAQDRWLRQFGTTLAREFDVDPFTVLVNSLCVY